MIFLKLFQVMSTNCFDNKLSSEVIINALMLFRYDVIEEQGELFGGFSNLSVLPNQE